MTITLSEVEVQIAIKDYLKTQRPDVWEVLDSDDPDISFDIDTQDGKVFGELSATIITEFLK